MVTPARFTCRLLSLVLALGTLAHAQLGPTEAEARQTDLFTFFHLSETARDPGAVTVVHFRPSGPGFHDLVEVNLRLAGGKVVGSQLSMKRTFMATSGGAFARDIASSYLRAVLTPRDATALQPFLKEISLESKSTTPSPADPPSTRAYLAYTCQVPDRTEGLQDEKVRIACDTDSVVVEDTVLPSQP